MTSQSPTALYVHVPFCAGGKCGYCDFYSEPRTDDGVRRYLDAVRREAALVASPGGPAFETIYIGGGTPTALTAPELAELLDIVRSVGPMSPRVEFTAEANPGTLDPQKLWALTSGGVNRLSLGAQSFNDRTLATLGRRHTGQETLAAVHMSRAAGLRRLSLDLIFAVPGQSPDDWARDLDEAVACGVEHLSTYALTWESDTPMTEALARGELSRVGEDAELAMFERAIDVLTAEGYEHYEISNFARPGYACRHNAVYWANEPYLGLGPSAVSYLQGERRRNVASIASYAKELAAGRPPVDFRERLAPEASARETAVMNLRRRRGIDFAEFERRTGFDARRLFANEFPRLAADGWLEVGADSARLTRRGLRVADTVLGELV